MGNSIVKTLKGAVSADVRMESAIRVAGSFGHNTTDYDQYIRAKAVSSVKAKTFAKCVSGNALINSISQTPAEITNFDGGNNGFLYVQDKAGSDYPRIVVVDMYPKYNFEVISVNRISDVDKYMTNLKTLLQEEAPSDSIYDVNTDQSEDIGVLADVTSLEKMSLYGDSKIIGDIAQLGKLTNLVYFHGHGTQVYGDLKDLLDAMYANGRTSGELIFGSASNLLVLTYNGTTMRMGYDAYQESTYYGWRFVFSANGWSVAETYTDYSSIPTIDSV
jgi:hypothetical protein